MEMEEEEGSIANLPTTRIAVVTGRNKGIGLEVCRQLTGKGVTVVLAARDMARGTAAVEKLRDLGLSGVTFHQLDVTDGPSVTRLAEFLEACFGKLDILVNNAAIADLEYADVAPGAGEVQWHGHEREAWMGAGTLLGDIRRWEGSPHFRNEELRQELDDVESLTEERLDAVVTTFMRDMEAGAAEARG
ncbi:hypothetical protein ACP4OV_008410 [Aristida adscensionis]